MKSRLFKLNIYFILLISTFVISSCSDSSTNVLNPYGEDPVEELGTRTNQAILGNGGAGGESQDDTARHALETMATQQRALDPKPYAPVRLPSVVRLMWVPDHLNKYGDLVPAHYYYLKVLEDRWKLNDAFDIKGQLDATTNGSGGGGSATPWVYQRR